MLEALVLIPLLLVVPAFLLPSDRVRSWLLPLAGGCHLLLVVLLWHEGGGEYRGDWIGADPLGLLVLGVVSLLYCCCSLYAVGYLAYRRDRGNRVMVPCLLIFLAFVTLAAFARHLGVLWVAVEATTLASAPLIYYNRNPYSIEATWKYLLLCSVGIALAMLGILFIAYAALHGQATVSLQLDDLLHNAGTLSPPWLRAGFVLVLVGFGGKMGLAPLHSWKPDAYGEAPGLVGALLAGGLTSVAFLGILRALQIMGAAGEIHLARQLVLALGLVSIALAAAFMLRQADVKRLLAYSSVEHMGILAIGVGVGGLGTFAALLHLVCNALTKGVMFLSVGNIQRAYASKRLGEISGAMRRVPVSAGLFLAGFLAVTGSPPFALFVSEFTLARGLFAAGRPVVAALFLLCLAVVFIGMAGTVLSVTQGDEPEGAADSGYRDSFLMVAPPLFLFVLVLVLGIWLPAPLTAMLERAAALLEVCR